MTNKKLGVKIQCGITPENITELKENEIFVFGSNLAGIHGAGAAKLAKDKFGAKLLVGHGMTGNCYAFPTKDQNIQTIALDIIPSFIYYLHSEIQRNPEKHFLVTKVGCGLAGYSVEEIAPLFKEFICYENCSLPQEFIDVIKRVQDNNM